MNPPMIITPTTLQAYSNTPSSAALATLRRTRSVPARLQPTLVVPMNRHKAGISAISSRCGR
ncbi:hypothetical protein D3C76_1358420 [compost metagenome]